MTKQKLSDVKTVEINSIYRNKETNEQVVVFYSNMGRTARFSPVGQSLERNMPIDDFLAQFELVSEDELVEQAQASDEAAEIPSQQEKIDNNEAEGQSA